MGIFSIFRKLKARRKAKANKRRARIVNVGKRKAKNRAKVRNLPF